MLRALRSAAAAAGCHFDGCLPAWLHSARSLSLLHDELLPVVAIVGRPNVGKSALFNRLARARKSIVHDTPDGHVTRDYQEAPAQLGDLRFLAIDTSGLEPLLPSGSIQARATGLTTQVLRRADVAMLLLDGRVGVLPGDAALARWLRGPAADVAEKVLLVANKCERRRRDGGAGVGWVLAEASSLGFGEPVALSAETGEGLAELYEALAPRLDPLLRARRAAVEEIGGEVGDDRDDDVLNPEANTGGGRGRRGQRARRAEEDDSKARPVRIAIMGLVNVGKSTLTNVLLNQERCLTGPEPGLTRDAISVGLTFMNRPVELVDTAGWVRRARLAAHDDSGGAVSARTLEEARTVLRFVHVVVLVVDAAAAHTRGQGLTHAEAALAAEALRQGRSLVVVANKLDALSGPQQQQQQQQQQKEKEALALIAKAVEETAPEVRGGAVLGVSALTGEGVGQVLPAALHAHDTWCRRVPTARLNRWVEQTIAGMPAGGPWGDFKRIKFLSQVKARPPTFVAFVSGAAEFGEGARRFVANQLRKEFGLMGVPVRVDVRRRLRQRQKQK